MQNNTIVSSRTRSKLMKYYLDAAMFSIYRNVNKYAWRQLPTSNFLIKKHHNQQR